MFFSLKVQYCGDEVFRVFLYKNKKQEQARFLFFQTRNLLFIVIVVDALINRLCKKLIVFR